MYITISEEKSRTKMWATYSISQKTAQSKNSPNGENSPNLVPLLKIKMNGSAS
jgi:hypothetical protein